MKKIIISITVSLTISVSIFAQSSIMSANTFKCKWVEGHYFAFIKGSLEKGSKKWGDVTILQNINLQNNTARLTAEGHQPRGSDLRVYQIDIGLLFTEQTLSSFLTIVIYKKPTVKNSNVFPTFYHNQDSEMNPISYAIKNNNHFGYCKIFD